jgi:transcriptional regulator with XRE-family HTH domain
MAQKYYKLGDVLRRLLFDWNMKPADLAREVNIPPPTIHRLLTGKSTRPYKSSLMPIAEYFSVKIEQLLGEEPLSKTNDNPSTGLIGSSTHNLPHLPWEFLHLISSLNRDLYEKLPFHGKISNNSWATTIQDSSMEPIFARGSILIFDPCKPHKDRSYVLIQLHDSERLIFRQLLIDAEHNYLKPLNPDLNAFKMRLLRSEDKIVATLVEARHMY